MEGRPSLAGIGKVKGEVNCHISILTPLTLEWGYFFINYHHFFQLFIIQLESEFRGNNLTLQKLWFFVQKNMQSLSIVANIACSISKVSTLLFSILKINVPVLVYLLMIFLCLVK